MGFSDKIIAGKQKKVDELEEVIKAKDLKYEQLYEGYDDIVEKRTALEGIANRHKEAHDEAVEKMHE